jgi:hypothetical protein
MMMQHSALSRKEFTLTIGQEGVGVEAIQIFKQTRWLGMRDQYTTFDDSAGYPSLPHF